MENKNKRKWRLLSFLPSECHLWSNGIIANRMHSKMTLKSASIFCFLCFTRDSRHESIFPNAGTVKASVVYSVVWITRSLWRSCALDTKKVTFAEFYMVSQISKSRGKRGWKKHAYTQKGDHGLIFRRATVANVLYTWPEGTCFEPLWNSLKTIVYF